MPEPKDPLANFQKPSDVLRELSPLVRAVSYVVYATVTGGLVLTLQTVTSDSGERGICYFVATLGLVIGYGLWIWKFGPSLSRKQSEFDIASNWKVLRQPLPEGALDRVRGHLEEVRQLAAEQLKSLADENVRANIFLPDYRQAPEGVAFELLIPPRLRLGMKDPKELKISFLPGEGATGVSFLSRVYTATVDKNFGIEEDSRKRKLVTDNLKGILSIPLIKTEPHVLAILNVDVINEDVQVDSLESLYEKLRNDGLISKVSAELNKLPCAWVTIGLKKIEE